jgi:O-antigen/teichoic acid export membrane protein
MVGSLVATSGLGFVYWLIAARAFPEAAVGAAAAAVSAMWLFGSLGMLGLGTLLTRELPAHPGREGSLILAAVGVSTVAGAGLGVGFAIIAPLLGPELGDIGASIGSVALFATGVGLTASSEVLDLALIGAARPGLQLARNVSFAVIKLIAVALAAVWFADATGMAIYATWVAGLAASVVGVVALVVARLPHGGQRRPAFGAIIGLAPSALGHHILNVARLAPSWVLPIVVAITISAEATSAYFVAALFAGIAFYVPDALTYTLYAVGSRDPAALPSSLRATLTLSLAAALAALAVMALIGPWLLGLYGATYAERATVALLVLTAAVMPLSIRAHWIAVRRIQGRIALASSVAVVGSIAEIAAATAGGVLWGIDGTAVGFALVMAGEGLLMSPHVLGIARRT